MFNRYVTEQATKQKITVNEHRAPTDDSVRLLREMEDRAWDKVNHAMLLQVEPLKLEALVVERHYHPTQFKNVLEVKFMLNSHALTAQVEIDGKMSAQSPEKLSHILNDAVCECIARVITSECWKVATFREAIFKK